MFSAVENGRPIEENNNQEDSNVKKPPLRSLDVFAGCGGEFLYLASKGQPIILASFR